MAFGQANKITTARLLVSPLVVLLFYLGVPDHPKDISMINPWLVFAANFLLFMQEITDMVDGYLARKHKEVSNFGKLVDPLADKVSHLGGYLCLMHAGLASIWVLLILIYRESVVCTLRVMAAKAGKVVQARISGKLKAITQGGALNFLFLFMFIKYFWHPFPLEWIATVFNIIVVTVAIISGIDYYFAIIKVVGKAPWQDF